MSANPPPSASTANTFRSSLVPSKTRPSAPPPNATITPTVGPILSRPATPPTNGRRAAAPLGTRPRKSSLSATAQNQGPLPRTPRRTPSSPMACKAAATSTAGASPSSKTAGSRASRLAESAIPSRPAYLRRSPKTATSATSRPPRSSCGTRPISFPSSSSPPWPTNPFTTGPRSTSSPRTTAATTRKRLWCRANT